MWFLAKWIAFSTLIVVAFVPAYIGGVSADGQSITSFRPAMLYSLSRFIPFTTISGHVLEDTVVAMGYLETYLGLLTVGVLVNVVSHLVMQGAAPYADNTTSKKKRA